MIPGGGQEARLTNTPQPYYSVFFSIRFPPQIQSLPQMSIKSLIRAVKQSSQDCYKPYRNADDDASREVWAISRNPPLRLPCKPHADLTSLVPPDLPRF